MAYRTKEWAPQPRVMLRGMGAFRTGITSKGEYFNRHSSHVLLLLSPTTLSQRLGIDNSKLDQHYPGRPCLSPTMDGYDSCSRSEV